KAPFSPMHVYTGKNSRFFSIYSAFPSTYFIRRLLRRCISPLLADLCFDPAKGRERFGVRVAWCLGLNEFLKAEEGEEGHRVALVNDFLVDCEMMMARMWIFNVGRTEKKWTCQGC
ncbi:hypothetical protein U1Q18_049589, partial [Sarracenia purpurea var. burkii]